MPDSVPVFILEARDVTIHCVVRNAPKPMTIKGELIAPPPTPSPSELAKMKAEERERDKRRAERKAKRDEMLSPDAQSSSPKSKSSSSSADDEDDDDDEPETLDSDLKAFEETALSRPKRAAVKGWEEALKKYEPVSYNAKVTLEVGHIDNSLLAMYMN